MVSLPPSASFLVPRKVLLLFAVLFISFDLSHCYDNVTGFSTPEECKRECIEGESPKNCYYRFHIEFYTTVGPACDKGFEKECVWADGYEKTILSINRQIPGPPIEVCLGDTIVVDVENAAPGLEVTIHWHGLFQNGYQYYDGVPYVTQCPIPSSTTFRYTFGANNAGTHFYHSHMSTHMLDGQIGSLIVKTPRDPHKNLYDDERVIMLNDWMHTLSLERLPGVFSRPNPGQAAQNILINGLGNWTEYSEKDEGVRKGRLTVIDVKPMLRYRVRIINAFSTVCPVEILFHGHRCSVIAQDGEEVYPKTVDRLVTTAGERVDCIITANKTVDSYWIHARGLGECGPPDNSVHQLAILRYAGASSTPSEPPPTYNDVAPGVIYNGLDASKCNTTDDSQVVCVNQFKSLKTESEVLGVDPDEQHIMDFWFFNYTQYGDNLLFKADSVYPAFFDASDKSQLLSMFNDISFETPSSPLISDFRSYRTVCKQNELSTCHQPCTCTQVIPAKYGAVVELVIYDSNQLEGLYHPFHLHGHSFQVFGLGTLKTTGNITRAEMGQVLQDHRRRLKEGLYKNPPSKDTVKIPQGGFAIIRFKADNPGWWLIHCHFTWHHLTGMELVIRVGEQYQLPPVPPGFPECSNWTPALNTLNNFYGFRYPQIYN
ncbi:uncharacterized protein LOC143213521 [Lasioglossum baleicum]|uniref:uncharacterized protein LOC143213521 n=1 Tax=Lasioglossum baleicum TaxID=434251 RepID=UPI003FCC465E